jgi:glycosyltransferase involved in cell wall biosynthesis
MPEPRVSVVMSVFNGDRFLRGAIASILTQEAVDLEFVIVDDASTDTTPVILNQAVAADSRVKLLRQAENQGLTRSLIRGCAASRGEYIARIDADDVALPGRLARQAAALDASLDVSFVSCGTRFVTDDGDLLFERRQDLSTAQTRLLELDLGRFEGVSSHPSVMLRREAYEAVGGYRPEFYFAQDVDLWIRLAERSRFQPMPEILQLVRFRAATLSSQWRAQQVKTAKLILEAARRRREGRSETEVLHSAAAIRPTDLGYQPHRTRAAALYFIGACLRRNGNPRCRHYFRGCLAANPFHVRARLALLVSPGDRARSAG